MSTATLTRPAVPTVAEISAAIDETRERLERKRTDLAERRQDAERFREQIGVVVADDGDVTALRRQLREADDDVDSLERAIVKLGADLTPLEEQLSAATAREAAAECQRAQQAFAATVDEIDAKITVFVRDVFVPLDAKHTAGARAANQAQVTAAQVRGIAHAGMSAAEKVWVEHRQAGGVVGLQRVMDELRNYARAAGLTREGA